MKTKGIYKIICLLVFSLVFGLSTKTTSAKTVTHVKEYTYQASEVDSKLSCRTIALEQVKRLLLEELGTYLVSETTVKNFQLTKDQISSLTAGVVMTVILEENWDGKNYFLRAKITTDTDELIKSIDKVRKNQEQSKNWEEIAKKTEEALKEIEKLKREIDKGKGEKDSQEKYAKAVKELNAVDWFKKGYALRYKEKDDQEALKAFDKAIELDPRISASFLQRGHTLLKLNKKEQALEDIKKAASLGNKQAQDYLRRKGIQ